MTYCNIRERSFDQMRKSKFNLKKKKKIPDARNTIINHVKVLNYIVINIIYFETNIDIVPVGQPCTK